MSNETEVIRSHLQSYADDIGVHVIAARDYGSRARNLESASSDYDVFFIYAEKPSEYAVGSDTDTYSRTVHPDDNDLDTEIEMHGWSLEKFVGNDGIAGSNPTAIEFTLSPVQYLEPTVAPDVFEQLDEHALRNFKPYALINHYRSMAASNYGKYVEGDYKISSGASYQDLLDLAEFHDVDDDQPLQVSEQDTAIENEHIHLTAETVNRFHDRIDVDDAIDAGLVEETTQDPTVKRHLSIVQSLMRARYVEETHEAPSPMDFTQFVRDVVDEDWMPSDVYTETGDLIAAKLADDGREDVEPEAIHDWIESELSREIEPEQHVMRQPDTETVREYGKRIYEQIEW